MKFFAGATLFLLLLQLWGGEFRLAATADLHGSLPELALLAEPLSRFGAEVKIDLGDLTQGTVESDHFDGIPMMNALNMLDFQLYVPGNHEFEMGQKNVEKLCRTFQGKVLGANWRSGNFLPLPWRIFRKGNFSCAVIGMTENRLYNKAPLLPGFTFAPAEEALKKTLQELRRYKVNVIILAWHNGYRSTLGSAGRVLWKFPEIDLLICSHVHAEIPGARAARALVVQPGARGTSAVALTIVFDDRTGRKRFITSRLLKPGKSVHPGIQQLYAKCRQRTAALRRSRRIKLSARNCAELLLRCCKGDAAVFDMPQAAELRELDRYDFYRLFAYRNSMCILPVTAEELRTFIAETVPEKRRRVVVYAGESHRQKRQISLVVSDYQIVSSPTLQKLMHRAKLTLLVERELIDKEFF